MIIMTKYYRRIKNNVKGTWNILNRMIRNGAANTSSPDYFTDDKKTFNNLHEVVERFYKLFVRVGPKLSEQADDPQLREGVQTEV